MVFFPDVPTSRLVFRLWPNGPRAARQGARLEVGRVSSRGETLRSRLVDPTTLVVRPRSRLQAGDRISVALPWRLSLPGPVFDRIARHGDALRLGSFFPLLAWVPGVGWATDPPTSSLAEASTSPTADFDVRVSAPRGSEVLATGVNTWRGRFKARAVRDFALAIGDFDTARRVIKLPREVEVTVGVDAGIDQPPDVFLAKVTELLRHLARRYGPYPWKTFTLAIVPGLASAGIEYPTLVFQGAQSLERTTSHELAHQWFYSLVGSDQARDPWLDEALASWIGATEDDYLDFFLNFPIPPAARGRLGAPMTYWDKLSESDYFAGVYAQGAQALDSLGAAERVDCALRFYAAKNAYGIATSRGLVAVLERFFPRREKLLARYGLP